MNFKDRLLHTLAFTVLAMAGFSIVTIFFWLYYPYKTVVFQDSVFTVITKTVKRSSHLSYISNYCKYINKPALVTRTFTNELLFSTPTMVTNRSMGCNTITVSIEVPQELPVGTYHLANTYLFEVNPVRKIIISENTEEFKVVE